MLRNPRRATGNATRGERVTTCSLLALGVPGEFRARARARVRARIRAVALALALALALVLLAVAAPSSADELRGTVRDPSGAAVVGADFDVFDPVTGVKLLPSDHTDAAGRYSLLLDMGVYDVLCEPDTASGHAAKLVRGVAVSGTVTLDITLAPSVAVRGRAFDSRNPDPGSNGVIGVDLDFDRSVDGVRAAALGDATLALGTFSAFVEAGSYTITATPDPATGLAPARVFGWAVPTPEYLEIPLSPPAFLSGQLRDLNGAAVEGAVLKFDDALGRRIPSLRNKSASDGRYSAGVTPGVYRVTIEPASGSHCTALRMPDVDLSSDRSQDFTLALGVAVSGRVTDRMGRPVSGADWDAVLEATGHSALTPGDRTGADGRFRFVVVPGTYRLRVSPPAGSGLDTLSFANVALASDTTLDVDYVVLSGGGPGSSPVVYFAPVQNPTHSTAAVSLVLRAPVRDGSVEIYDVGGRRVSELHRGALPAGARSFAWDGRSRSGRLAHTGVFFVRARLDGFEQVTRFILLP